MATVRFSAKLIVKFSKVQSVRGKAFCNITPVRKLDNKVLAEATFNKYRGLENPVKASVNIERLAQKWFPKTFGFVEFKESGYFSSMDSSVSSPSEITSEEYSSCMAVKVFLTMPELNIEREIPQKDIGEVRLIWGVNQPIQWSVNLRNYDRDYTDPAGINGYLFSEGIYCPQKKTRKYIKIKFRSWCGEKVMDLTFPRLVIQRSTGNYVINISGVDETCEYLFRKTDLPTYVAEEALSRIDEGSLSTWQKSTFYAVGDKVFPNFSYITQLKDVHPIAPEVVPWFIPIGTKYIPKILPTGSKKYFELVGLTYATAEALGGEMSR